MSDIIVNITETVNQPSVESFGKALLVDFTKTQIIKSYDISNNIDAVKVDYAETTLVYKKVAAILKETNRPSTILIVGQDKTATGWEIADIDEMLDTAVSTNPDFIRVFTTSTETTEMKRIADWCDENSRFFYGQLNEIGTTDFSANTARINLYTQVDRYLDAVEIALASSKLPGTFNYKWKAYKSVTPDKLTSDKVANAEVKKYGYYIPEEGDTYQRNSYCTNGQFMDYVEAKTYIKMDLTKALRKLFIANDKIDSGRDSLSLIVSSVTGSLQDKVDKNILESFSVSYNNATFDKETRKWKNISFTAVYIHGADALEITGEVEV